jgi:malate dehydrogenase
MPESILTEPLSSLLIARLWTFNPSYNFAVILHRSHTPVIITMLKGWRKMKVAIIGAAGTLGSCAAFNILIHKLADEILMIDPWADVLTGHCMDLGFVASTLDVKVTKGSYENLGGTDIVVMTAGAPSGVIKSRTELLPANLVIVKDTAEKINRYCPGAIVIMETNPVDPLNYAMYLLSKDRNRRRYIGYCMNDALRFRMWSAEALKVPACQVDGTVLGEHGSNQVMLFSSLKVSGKPVVVTEEVKAWVRAQPQIMLNIFENLKPKRTAGWVSSVGTAAIINAIKNNTRELLSCNVVLQGEYGCRNMAMSVPAVVGKNGIEDIRILPLAEDEKTGLAGAVSFLMPFMRQVEDTLGIKI